VLSFISQNQQDIVLFKFIDNKVNKGVCAAKNCGAFNSSGSWIIFLDSDDELVSENIEDFMNVVRKNESCPVHFFSCINESGELVGDKSEITSKRDFNQFLLYGTSGESLPVVNRKIFQKYPYDEDLSGFEGLSYLRIVDKYGYAMIHSVVLRKYHTVHEDRLSSATGIRKRSKSLFRGYCRILHDLYSGLNMRAYVYVITRCVYHGINYLIQVFLKRKSVR